MSGSSSTYVLIPGAWHGGWSWRPVAERLRAAGHRAVCLTLPGLNDGDDPTGLRLQDAVDHVVAEVEKLGVDEVILVGHSWAGYPMAGAAYQLAGKVSKAVYYSAQVPVRGRSMVEDHPPEAAALLTGLIEASPTRSIAAGFEFVKGRFMQDVPEEAQRLLAELLTPQPGAYFLDGLDVPNMTELGIPSLFLLSEHDHAMPKPGAEFAARLGVEPVIVPGTHEALLTHPDEIAKAILTG